MKENAIISLKNIVSDKLADVAVAAEWLPGIITITDVRDHRVVFMSDSGLKRLHLTLEELKRLPTEEYYNRYFNPIDLQYFAPKIEQLLEDNDDEKSISFFHQLKDGLKNRYTWYVCSVRIFLRSEDGSPMLIISNSFPLETFSHISTKLGKFLQEDRFVREHYEAFGKLGKREREVLKLMALGKSSAETAEELFISTATVETHRKNIKQKLGTNSFYQLCEYARAFDMI